MLQSINPWTLETIYSVEEMSEETSREVLQRLDHGYDQWKKKSLTERQQLIELVAERLEQRQRQLAATMAAEMGKPLSQGISEVKKCQWLCKHYLEMSDSYLKKMDVVTESDISEVYFEPLGVLLLIMPWNFPLWQTFRVAVPYLLAGNTICLKHASNVSKTSLEIESLFQVKEDDTDSNPDFEVFRSVFVSGAQSEFLIAQPEIKGVSFTGSTEAGRQVGAATGKYLKKSVLELGGSDPYLVLADADIDLAVEKCVASRLINSGQSCIAAKRFIVIQGRHQEFIDKMLKLLKSKTVGDPMQNVDVGPLARQDLREDLHRQVVRSVEMGAELLLGGEIENQNSAVYPVTMLANVTDKMPSFCEETFGPVASVIVADSEEHGIRLANATEYGLGSAIFSRDFERARRIAAHEILAGSCFINDLVKSDPRLPFGGIKHSGYGRELGVFGIREFVNIKTVSGNH